MCRHLHSLGHGPHPCLLPSWDSQLLSTGQLPQALQETQKSGSRVPCMDLFFHGLRACSDSSQHKHLCGLGPGMPPHSSHHTPGGVWTEIWRRRHVPGERKALQTGALALYLLLHIGSYEFEYSACDKQMGIHSEWRLPTSPGLPGVAAQHRAFSRAALATLPALPLSLGQSLVSAG